MGLGSRVLGLGLGVRGLRFRVYFQTPRLSDPYASCRVLPPYKLEHTRGTLRDSTLIRPVN